MSSVNEISLKAVRMPGQRFWREQRSLPLSPLVTKHSLSRLSAATDPPPMRYFWVGQSATDPPPSRYRARARPDGSQRDGKRLVCEPQAYRRCSLAPALIAKKASNGA